VLIELGGVLSAVGRTPADLAGDAALSYRALLVLGNGFILTSVLWGAALAWMIDRRLLLTAAAFALASLATLFGVIHSPLPTGALFWPWSVGVTREVAWPVAAAYGLLAAMSATLALRRAV
jgi:AGZA family xanthine/uracil permease-like MFS transporter